MSKISLQKREKNSECISKPKDLWKAITSLGLTNKSGGCIVDVLAEYQIVRYTQSFFKTFKSFHSKLAGDLLAKLPTPSNWYTITFVSDYYKKLSLSEYFRLDSTTKICMFKLLKNVEVTKDAGIDQISEKLLKHWLKILAKRTSEYSYVSFPWH